MPARTDLFAFLLAVSVAGCLPAQEPAGDAGGPVAEIRSINPADTDFADLQAVRESIGDARIVMLGEQSHGDGSTFLAKTRLIRFLHEEMDFDVLAFESGIYDTYAAQALIEGGAAASEALTLAITPVWANSRQVAPLFEYVEEQSGSADPLRVAGFDSQFTNALARELPDKLEAFGERVSGSDALPAVAAGLRALFSAGPTALQESSIAKIESQYGQAIDDITALAPPDVAYWQQILRSTRNLLIFIARLPEQTPEVFNMRDAQMAENLIWLAETAFPDSRIVVWAATSHVIKDRSAVETSVAREMVPMGAYVHESFGRDARVLAFTTYEGKTASFATREVTSIGTAPEGGVESALAETGFDYAFMDASDLERLDPTPRSSWIMGYEPMEADWERVVDGFFFIRTNEPSEFLTPANGRTTGTQEER